MNDSDQIEHWAQSVLKSLSPVERKKNFRQLAIALRKKNQKRMNAQQNPDETSWTPRKNAGPVARKKKMMLGLRKAKRLKIHASQAGLSLGYEARDAKIARIHHFGLSDRPSPKSSIVNYPTRQLLGISTADSRFLHDWLLKQLFSS